MIANTIGCFALSIVLLIYSGISMAYSKPVHERITDEAIQQNLGEIDKSINNYTGITGVDARINGKTIRRWIQDGSWMEDLGMDILTSHFYNPLTNKGLTKMGVEIGESAYDRANNPSNSTSWKYARSTFYSGLTAKTKADRDLLLSFSFFALGHSLHLVQDVAVPAHTRDNMSSVEVL